MKTHYLIFIVAAVLISVLNSCRHGDNLDELPAENILQEYRRNADSSRTDTLDRNIPADPPVRDGQQWKHKK